MVETGEGAVGLGEETEEVEEEKDKEEEEEETEEKEEEEEEEEEEKEEAKEEEEEEEEEENEEEEEEEEGDLDPGRNKLRTLLPSQTGGEHSRKTGRCPPPMGICSATEAEAEAEVITDFIDSRLKSLHPQLVNEGMDVDVEADKSNIIKLNEILSVPKNEHGGSAGPRAKNRQTAATQNVHTARPELGVRLKYRQGQGKGQYWPNVRSWDATKGKGKGQGKKGQGKKGEGKDKGSGKKSGGGKGY